jgi:glutamate--cysteine ligase catalytic subunit
LVDKAGIDDRLAEHIARLFVRDPVPAYEGEFLEEQLDDNDLVCHFENFQSTNWGSLRFKPPPSQDANIGWRVEFRTMDIQMTDFENSCLIVLMGLITNVINHFNVDFIMPVTLVDENMARAHKRDAILNEKFWWKVTQRKMDDYTENCLHESNFLKSTKKDEQIPFKYEELYVHEIISGKQSIGYIGIVDIIRKFLEI